ncbi:MAG: hypothetical protein AAFN41_04835 [Planctomycetota bacterium]
MAQEPMDQQQNASLLEGIEFEKRKTVDADWSKAKRIAVGSVATLLAVAAIGAGGWFAWQHRPVSFPESTEQALAMVKSGRIERLPADRQRQWYAEAAPLLAEVPREEWRTSFDEDDRQAAREIMRAQFGESIREVARGNQSPQEMFANMMRGRRPNTDGNDGERRAEGGNREGGEGDRPSRADRQANMRDRLGQAFQNGDAQQTGLMGEFFTMMRAQREANGGQGGRPGSGPGGRPNGGG